MKNLMLKSRLRSIMHSLVLTTVLPLLYSVSYGTKTNNPKEETSFVDSIQVQKISSCNCNNVSKNYLDTFNLSNALDFDWQTSSLTPGARIDTFIKTQSYLLVVVEHSGKGPYEINMSSNTNTHVKLSGNTCEPLTSIDGDISACIGGTETYSLTNPHALSNYTFQVNGGGSITSNSNTATIIWGNIAGVYTISAINTSNPCQDTIQLKVTVGASSIGTLACNAKLNISLDSTCKRYISVEEIVTSNNSANSAMAIMLLDQNENAVPNNTLTSAHIGQTFTVKAFNGCGGNSCWGTVTLEDKLAPNIVCQDTIAVSCFDNIDVVNLVKVSDCSKVNIINNAADKVEELSCDPQYVRKITKSFYAVDAFGNQSKPCQIVIKVKKFPIDSIVFPTNLDTDVTQLNCTALVNNTVNPTLSGFPKYKNLVLNNREYIDCALQVLYEDQLVELGTKKKLIRKWIVRDYSCSPEKEITKIQIIIIGDAQAPKILKCVDNITSSTYGQECVAKISIPKISPNNIIEVCDPLVKHFIILANGNRVEPNVGLTFPLGSQVATYFVQDASGKKDSCVFSITILDREAPVVVCKDSISLSLVGKNTPLTEEMININSYDNCTPVKTSVKKMTDSIWRDTVYFQCEDANKSILIQLRISDENGNTNFCMVRVNVQDKLPPYLEVPSDLTISCDQLQDKRPLSTYGNATFYEECNPNLTVKVDTSLNNCKEGTITRTWKATDGVNTVTKTQKIFVINNSKVNPDSIIPPPDITIDGRCTLGNYKDSIPKPKIPFLSCGVLATNYTDQVFEISTPVARNCTKIMRTWTVINWCGDNPGKVIKTMLQTIVIENNIAPTIKTLTTSTIFNTDDCEKGSFTLSAEGNDDCTPDASLRWKYEVTKIGNTTVLASGSGSGKTFIAANTLLIGSYKIDWVLTDGCGNESRLSQNFTIRYGKAPSFALKQNLVLGLTAMNNTEMACIKADSCLAGSYNNPCGLSIKYSFSTDINDTIKCFDCANLGNNLITVYGTDPFGNRESVNININIQDNNDVEICKGFGSCILWPKDTAISNCVENISPTSIGSSPRIASNCDCNNFELSFNDVPTSDIRPGQNQCNVIERMHTVTFKCGGQNVTFRRSQLLTLRNRTNPIIQCQNEVINAQATTGCSTNVIVPAPRVLDSMCHTGLTLQFRRGNGTLTSGNDATGIYNVGTTLVTYVVTNACGRTSTCSFNVVVSDAAPPICRVRNVSIQLNAQGQATIGNATIFNNGTADECNNNPVTFSVDRTNFNCSNLNTPTTVTITTTDASGNASRCTANVTVIDTIRPRCQTINITKEITAANQVITLTKGELLTSATDNCSIIDTVLSRNTFTCADLGANVVRVLLRDAAGNTSTCEATVTIVDKLAPICKLKTATVTVNGGVATLDSASIDDGSSDACGRIISLRANPSTFTCADIGQKVINVVVTDASGNTTNCQTTITVVDGGQLICATKDITVYLDATGQKTITANDVDNGSGTGCGNPADRSINISRFTCADVGTTRNVLLTITRPNTQISQTCTARVTVRDTLPPSLICGEEMINISCEGYNGTIPNTVPRPRVVGGCNGQWRLDSTIIRLSKPCNLDTLTRTYRLIDNNNNLLGVCVQTIMVNNTRVLGIDSFNLPPAVVTLNNCTSTNPTLTGGRPTVKTGVNVGCTGIKTTFADTYSNTTCNDTLRRLWTVSDSCKGNTIFTYLQRIAIIDNAPPVISALRDTVLINDANCSALFTAPAVSIADCDDRTVVRNNSIHATTQNSSSTSGRYPLGRHTITLTATDKCGNSSTRSFTIEVRDTGTQNIACKNVTKNIGAEGSVLVNASELVNIRGGFCNTAQFNLRIVMRPINGGDTIAQRNYTCANLTNRQRVDTMIVLVYNTLANPDTLVHQCQAIITIDGQTNCPSSQAVITSIVKSQTGEAVPGFEIIVDNGFDTDNSQTNEEGMAINRIGQEQNILVAPRKNDIVDEGVNTLDLLTIQKHILGVKKLPNPYSMIAADVNNDRKINVRDLIEVRDIILGQKVSFENSNSWVPIDATYRFSNTSNALSDIFPTTINIAGNQSQANISFVGVKMGDVDQSYKTKSQLSPRSKLPIIIQDVLMTLGETYTVSVDLPIQKLLALEADVTQNEVGEMMFGNDKQWFMGKNKIIAYAIEGISSPKMVIKAHKTGWLSELMDISAKAYDNNETMYELDIQFIKESIQGRSITGPYPNPWSELTTIQMETQIEEDIEIVVSDITGRQVDYFKQSLQRGRNVISIKKNPNIQTGIYLIKVTVGNEIKTYKTIVTN